MMRALLACLLLTGLALAGAPAHAAGPATGFSPQQREALDAMIHDYLLAHPETVVEALKTFDARRREQEAADARQLLRDRREELEADPTSPVGGNPQGDVTIVEFFDFRCPYCKAMAPSLAEIVSKDKGIRVVYKDLPVLGKDSVFASRLALAAVASGKYQAFHDAAFAAGGQLTQERSLEIARSVGLDPDALQAAMQSPQIDAILKHNMDLARALDIDGTPAFVVGDTLKTGAIDLEALQQMVAAARRAPPKG